MWLGNRLSSPVLGSLPFNPSVYLKVCDLRFHCRLALHDLPEYLLPVTDHV